MEKKKTLVLRDSRGAKLRTEFQYQYVGVPVVNVEYSLGRGQTNMAAKIFETLPLMLLTVITQHERLSPIMVLCGLVG